MRPPTIDLTHFPPALLAVEPAAASMGRMDIDLNCDLGEGCGLDEQLMPLITSANICCGFHAGDAETSAAALELAKRYGVRVGAHPGYADAEHFGRLEKDLTWDQVYALCLYQIGALDGLTRLTREPIRYLKPHGALYNQACRDDAYASPIITAALDLNLAVVGLAGSRLEALCKLPEFVREGFADRRYMPDGSLVPRARPDAFVDNVQEALQQAEWLMRERGVRTLCVHGDNPKALTFVRALRTALTDAGFTIRAFA
jgi:5-oxoprolinase (ATP-hydrolysing) subunit A